MSHPRADKQIAHFMNSMARILVAIGLTSWGVSNLWSNILAFNAPNDTQPSWWVALPLILLTAGVPLAIGLTELLKLAKPVKVHKKTAE